MSTKALSGDFKATSDVKTKNAVYSKVRCTIEQLHPQVSKNSHRVINKIPALFKIKFDCYKARCKCKLIVNFSLSWSCKCF